MGQGLVAESQIEWSRLIQNFKNLHADCNEKNHQADIRARIKNWSSTNPTFDT
jgi:hypothetical protein